MSNDESVKAYNDLCLLFTKYVILVRTHSGDYDIDVLAEYDRDSKYVPIVSAEDIAEMRRIQISVERVSRDVIEQCEEKHEVGDLKGVRYPCQLVEGHPGRHAFYGHLFKIGEFHERGEGGRLDSVLVNEDGSAWDGDDKLVY